VNDIANAIPSEQVKLFADDFNLFVSRKMLNKQVLSPMIALTLYISGLLPIGLA